MDWKDLAQNRRNLGLVSNEGSDFSLLHSAQADPGAHPASYPMSISVYFRGGGHVWNDGSTPRYVFAARCLIEHRDNSNLFSKYASSCQVTTSESIRRFEIPVAFL
jgi:hypothetical protein